MFTLDDFNKNIIDKSQTNIRTRLEEYLRTYEMVTPTEFALGAGIDPSGMIKMLKGQMKISMNTLKKISSSYSLRMEWLLSGEGNMHEEEVKPIISYTEGIPYYDESFECGFDELTPPDTENPEFLVRMPGFEKATLWCNASGHSMEPEICNGDIIALKRIEDFSFLPYGDIYGFVTTNGLRTIKRLGRSDKEGYFRLIPTNHSYDEQYVPINKICMVYRVMGAMKSF